MALEQEIPNELPYNDYFEYFGPDFKLHIAPSNMSNQNTSEYMDKIRLINMSPSTILCIKNATTAPGLELETSINLLLH